MSPASLRSLTSPCESAEELGFVVVRQRGGVAPVMLRIPYPLVDALAGDVLMIRSDDAIGQRFPLRAGLLGRRAGRTAGQSHELGRRVADLVARHRG